MRAGGSPYRHVQRGNTILALNMGLVVLFAVLTIGIRRATGSLGPAIAFIAGMVIIVIVAALFGTLTTEVASGTLRVAFGPGITMRRVALGEIAGVEVVRTSWWQGIGVRFTMRGTLYNVAVGPALLVTLKSGKSFLVGTDDAEGLRAAIVGPGGAGSSGARRAGRSPREA